MTLAEVYQFLSQQERLDIEEKYTSLQEEAQGKTKKLKKVWTMLMAAKSEVGFLEITYKCSSELKKKLFEYD